MPPTPYRVSITVAPEDIDRQGHVNNVTFVRYVQDAAVAHWGALAPAEAREAFTWVVRRHEVEYLKPAFLGDDLEARTWVGSPTAATWDRFTEIVRLGDGVTVVKARTVWVLLDSSGGRPRRVDPAWGRWLHPDAAT